MTIISYKSYTQEIVDLFKLYIDFLNQFLRVIAYYLPVGKSERN